MAYRELATRLNNRGYKNWLKAGQCLRVLKDGISPYIDTEMRVFHGDLLNQHTHLRRRCQRSCSLKGNRVSSLCPLCSEWLKVILRHHRNPDATVNWDNCNPAHWSQQHWELAKAYLPRGAYKKTAADQCDASALLNLLNFCDWFTVEPCVVREVIRCRNELMHSCEMSVDDGWMARYRRSLMALLHHLDDSKVVSLARAGQQMEEIFTVEWSTFITGSDQMDSGGGLEVDSASQWDAAAVSRLEADLLEERLQELLQDGDPQDAECLLRLRDFLQANADLGERFPKELQVLRPQDAAPS